MYPLYLCHSVSQHFNCFLSICRFIFSHGWVSLKLSQTNYLCIPSYYYTSKIFTLTDCLSPRSPCEQNLAFFNLLSVSFPSVCKLKLLYFPYGKSYLTKSYTFQYCYPFVIISLLCFY